MGKPDDLLVAAPDDEVLGEILALQAELARQVGVALEEAIEEHPCPHPPSPPL